MVYCVVPADLADELHEPLRAFYSDDRQIEVIVERRAAERRQPEDRRRRKEGTWEGGVERRKLRAMSGRRVAERRATQVPTATPELPPIAAPYANRISFIERFEPSTAELEDADTAHLIERIQAGEASLFDQIYMRYFDRVYAYVRLALQARHEAEDLTQDVFARLLELLPSYDRRAAPFRAWLFRIVRESAINRVRQRQRLAVESAEGAGDRADAELVPPPDSVRWLSDRELLSMIEQLSLSQRQVIVLHYMMGFRSSEIGKIMDRSPDQVRQLHQRAMRFLARRIENSDDDNNSEHTRVQRESIVRLSPGAPVLRRRQYSLR